jgi:short chain dehydrogenase
MAQKLAGKVAVVTGASKGIGASIALHLAAEGAAVVVNYSSSKEGADRVVRENTGKGGKAIAVQADVATVMRCESCHGIIMNGRSRTVLDDSGSLAITAWKCESCGGVTEEIQILSRYGKARPRRIRYAVKPQCSTRWLAWLKEEHDN